MDLSGDESESDTRVGSGSVSNRRGTTGSRSGSENGRFGWRLGSGSSSPAGSTSGSTKETPPPVESGSVLVSATASSLFSGAAGMWRRMTDKLSHLETRISKQASATQVQDSAVKELKAKVGAEKGAVHQTSWLMVLTAACL